MKKSLCFFVLCLVFSWPLRVGAEDISAKSAIVYQPQSKTVLYEKNAHEESLVASTTKIMTALVVLDRCALDEKVDIKQNCVGIEGSTMHLQAGKTYTVQELLYGMMLVSGNDAAAALACHAAGDMESFAQLMNDKARDLSLSNSHFVNPHGLDAEGHYSTAYDLALLTAAAMKYEAFRAIVATSNCCIQGVPYQNHNKLLRAYQGCTGGKTGYTRAAGRVLVSSCEREGLELICVTIAAPDDWNDHIKLYDEAYDNFCYVPLLSEEHARIPVISGTEDFVSLEAEPVGVLVKKDSQVEVDLRLPSFVFAPVSEGTFLGEVSVVVDGKKTCYPISCVDSVLLDGAALLKPFERWQRAWELSKRYGVYYPQM